MATAKKKTATKRKPAPKKQVVKSKTNSLKSDFKAMGIKLPHGYEVVKRAPKKKKAAKKRATPKKRVAKKVVAKKAAPKRKSTKKKSTKSKQLKMF